MNKSFGKAFGISITSSVLFFILGLFLVLKPETTISLVSTVIGIFFLLGGFSSISKYLSNKENQGFLKLDLTKGVILFVIGIILILKGEAVASVLPFIIGIYFIVNSITKIQYSLELKNYNKEKWLPTFVLAGVTLLCGAVFVLNPFRGAVALTQIIGVFIMIYSIVDVVNYSLLRKNFKDVINIVVDEPKKKRRRRSEEDENVIKVIDE